MTMPGRTPDNDRIDQSGPPRAFHTLSQKSYTPVWVQLGWRVLAVLALVGVAVAVHWFDRDGLRDNYDGHVSFLDIIYFTMISITTTGYGDIAPVTTSARMFDALIVTPIRVFVVLIFLGTAYNFVLKRTWDRWRMAKIQKQLHDHIVVCGFGETGTEAVHELIARGTDPRSLVVIDRDQDALTRAHDMGCTVMEGDVTRDEFLEDVQIERAQCVIAASGRDDTSILVVLTVRHLAPNVPISVIIRAKDNELLARQAGATNVINPVNFAGLLLAGSVAGEHTADYISDLASVTGRVALAERKVQRDEVGKSIRDVVSGIGVRIYRDGTPFGFWEPESQNLQAGDTLVEIIPGQHPERKF